MLKSHIEYTELSGPWASKTSFAFVSEIYLRIKCSPNVATRGIVGRLWWEGKSPSLITSAVKSHSGFLCLLKNRD